MSKSSLIPSITIVLMLVLVGCTQPGSAGPAASTAVDSPTVAPPPAEPAATEPDAFEPAESVPAESEAMSESATASEVLPAQPSFAPATYRDEAAGFELDYPADWTLDPSSQIGVRGAQALLLSPGSSAEVVADGGARVGITSYIWDPKNDLDAWVEQRKTAWDASGFAITREEQWQLADGRTVQMYIVETPEQPTLMLLTTIGEEYLQVSGEGDLTLAEEIARTLRPLE